MYIHLGIAEYHIPFSGHCDLDLLLTFKNYYVRSISLILFDRNLKFEIGISNLVCECILG